MTINVLCTPSDSASHNNMNNIIHRYPGGLKLDPRLQLSALVTRINPTRGESLKLNGHDTL